MTNLKSVVTAKHIKPGNYVSDSWFGGKSEERDSSIQSWMQKGWLEDVGGVLALTQKGYDMCQKEHVLCFPTDLLERLFDLTPLDVYSYLDFTIEDARKENSVYHYVEREEAETRYDLKQIIPYSVLYSRGMVLQYQRGKSGEEQRLHDLYSIGVGGHIVRGEGYTEAMERELEEEVSVLTPRRQVCAWIINDESTDVGRVHFGVVHIFELREPKVEVRERSLTKPEFVTIDHARGQIEKYERWSQICLKNWEAIWDYAFPLLLNQEWRD